MSQIFLVCLLTSTPIIVIFVIKNLKMINKHSNYFTIGKVWICSCRLSPSDWSQRTTWGWSVVSCTPIESTGVPFSNISLFVFDTLILSLSIGLFDKRTIRSCNCKINRWKKLNISFTCFSHPYNMLFLFLSKFNANWKFFIRN